MGKDRRLQEQKWAVRRAASRGSGAPMRTGGELDSKAKPPLRGSSRPHPEAGTLWGPTPRFRQSVPSVMVFLKKRADGSVSPTDEELLDLFGPPPQPPLEPRNDSRIIRDALNKRGGQARHALTKLMRERREMRARDQATFQKDVEWEEPPEIRESWDGPKPYFLEEGKASEIQRTARNYIEQAKRAGGKGVMTGAKAPGFKGILSHLEQQIGGKGKEAFQLKREIVEQVLDRPGAEKLTWQDLEKNAPELTKAWTWSVRKNAAAGDIFRMGPHAPGDARAKTTRIADFLKDRMEGRTGPWAAGDPHDYKGSMRAGRIPDVEGQMLFEGAPPPPAAVAKYSQAVYRMSQGQEDAADIMLRAGQKIEQGQTGGGNVVHMERAAQGEPWWKYDERRGENIKRGQKEKIEKAVEKLQKAQVSEADALSPKEAQRLRSSLENYRLTGVFGVPPKQTRGVRGYEDVRSTVDNPRKYDREMQEAELLDDVRARKRMEKDIPNVRILGRRTEARAQHPDVRNQMDLAREARPGPGRLPWAGQDVPVTIEQRKAWPLPKRAVTDFDRKRLLAKLLEGAERGDPRAARLVEVLGGPAAVAKGEVAAGATLAKALKVEPALLKLAKILMRV